MNHTFALAHHQTIEFDPELPIAAQRASLEVDIARGGPIEVVVSGLLLDDLGSISGGIRVLPDISSFRAEIGGKMYRLIEAKPDALEFPDVKDDP